MHGAQGGSGIEAELVAEQAGGLPVGVEGLGLASGATSVVLVSGLHAGADHTLGAGGEVLRFPPLGGG